MKVQVIIKKESIHNIKNENLYDDAHEKKKRKGGFTLIEVIAVMAIIGIMAAALLPKFTNYINEAKKLKVVEQSRKVVMAVESYNMKADPQIDKGNTVSEVMKNIGVKKYFEDSKGDIDKLKGGMSVNDCFSIVDGAEFSIDTSGKFSKIVSTPKEIKDAASLSNSGGGNKQ